MSKEKTHTQCKMIKRYPTRIEDGKTIPGSITNYVAWIPSKFAVVGKKIEIKFGETFDVGWEVSQVYTELPTAVVREREQDYKQTRKASDI